MKDMVDTPEFPGPLHSDHILWLGDHTDRTSVPAVIIADGAYFPVRQVLANRAGVDLALCFQNSVGKALGILERKLQHMKSQTLGSFSADTRKAGKLIRKILQRRGKKLHGCLLRTGRPG